MSEEDWLTLYTGPIENNEAEEATSFMAVMPTDGVINTVQMHHERRECVRRLVPCPRLWYDRDKCLSLHFNQQIPIFTYTNICK